MDATILVLQATGGFLLGGILGYTLRKAAQLLLVAAGLALLPVFALWSLGVLSVNWTAVEELLGRLASWLGVNLSNTASILASTGVLGISGLLGFFFGISGGIHSCEQPPHRKHEYVKKKA